MNSEVVSLRLFVFFIFVYLDILIFMMGMYCTFITGKYFDTILDKQNWKKRKEGRKEEGGRREKTREDSSPGQKSASGPRRSSLCDWLSC